MFFCQSPQPSPRFNPLCNLCLSLLDRMGVAVDQFDDSTGRLEGVG
jgi:hypothetical protein